MRVHSEHQSARRLTFTCFWPSLTYDKHVSTNSNPKIKISKNVDHQYIFDLHILSDNDPNRPIKMSDDKQEKNDKSGSMDVSCTSHTSGHTGLHDDEDYDFRVRRLSISESGESLPDMPTLMVPKAIGEFRTDSTIPEDIEMQDDDKLGEDMPVEEPCVTPKCIIFAVAGGAVVVGAIISIFMMRSNHYDDIENYSLD